MAPTDISSFISLIICLLLPLVAVSALTVALRKAGRSRRGRKRTTVREPQPTRHMGEAPLSADAGAHEPLEEEGHLTPGTDLPYQRRRYLLTQAERDFFDVLRAAAPEGWYVFPQVRLANLVLLKKGTPNWKPHFSRVAQKCVDFVLCDGAEVAPRLVIELDDSSHDRPDRQDRDAFVDAALRSAGLPILHVRWQRRYDQQLLARQIRDAAGLRAQLAPPVPQTPRPAPTMAPSGQRAARLPQTTSAAAPTGQVATAIPSSPRVACRRCEAEVSPTAKFCPGCGATLEL